MEMHPAVAPLPERLRAATRELHAQSERSGVMPALLRGRAGRKTCLALLRNLQPIYAALEADGPVLAALLQPGLRRAAALAADLEATAGPGWRDNLPLVPAARAYAERLAALQAAASPALVAHAYVRYLGDLHGGQVLKRLVGRQLGLADEALLRFYEFGSEDEVLALRQGLRQWLADRDPADADLIVDEACWAFRQHILLFEQLSRPKTS